MRHFTLTKLSGTGNTFLFIDARAAEFDDRLLDFFQTRSRAKIAKILCDPYQSVGADGVAFVENSVGKVNNSHLRWDFYNADGSTAEMCGNASRCFALYAAKLGIHENPLRFESRAGLIEVTTRPDARFEVKMTAPKNLKLKQKLAGLSFTFVNTGVPHAVVEVRFPLIQLSDRHLARLAAIDQKLKTHRRFKPASTNVTFYRVIGAGRLESLTFERGVRGYTQACGTGAVAAAIAYQTEKKYAGRAIRLKLPGGDVSVHLGDAAPRLVGPAKVIADITLTR